MKNPWLAKNPFLSMWLSAGSSVLGAARGHALNQVRRQQAAAMNEGARAVLAFWSGAALLQKSENRGRAKSR